MERSCISLEKRLDKCRCRHPNISTKTKPDHYLHNSGFSVLGLRVLCCSGVPSSELLSALCPSQHCLHPETGWPRAKSPRARVAERLLCGHLKQRMCLSLKAAPFLHYRGGQICFCRAVEGAPWLTLPVRYAGSAQAVAAPSCLSDCQWSSHGPARWLKVVPSWHGAHAHNSGDLQLWPWVPDHLSLFARAVGSCGVSQERGSAWGRVSIAEWSWIELRVELCDLLCNSEGRQDDPWWGGGISGMLLHLGFSVRHTPVAVFWRVWFAFWRPLVPPNIMHQESTSSCWGSDSVLSPHDSLCDSPIVEASGLNLSRQSN